MAKEKIIVKPPISERPNTNFSMEPDNDDTTAFVIALVFIIAIILLCKS